jgi:hypothetical protein
MQEMIEIDLDGKAVAVPRDVVSDLAAAAAARAGVSDRHRELSLQLNRGLETGRVSLGRRAIIALVAVLEQEQDGRFGPAAAELLRAVA